MTIGRIELGQRQSRRAFVRDILLIALIALLASVLIKTFLVRSFSIPSASMQATLQEGDRVIVNELQPSVAPLARGDVVVFRDPGGWLHPSGADTRPWLVQAARWVGEQIGFLPGRSSDYLIKRVIGLPGDTVSCCSADGTLEVNGVPITEPYLQLPPGVTLASGVAFRVVVPKDSLWVMGDNRFNSADSRAHIDTASGGFVPYPDVVGRAFAVTSPLSRLAWLGDYPEVFADVGRRSE